MIRNWAVLAGGICTLAVASANHAAVRAESALECGIAADMALVAQSLALENIQQAQAGAIMARIYDVSESERGRELMKDILNAAYQSSGAAAGGTAAPTAQKFAEKLFAVCMETGGSLDQVLGQKS
ncbi:MAG TPA: hypothetical protein VD965_00345 [Burkholderiales bacterium]|nr:hypothetical protein [Burkholderiales bacterium]